jgi:hypothetical protein
MRALLLGKTHCSKIEGKESNNSKYNSNPEMAFGTDQSSKFRASAMVVYPEQYPQASVKGFGSGDPPKPHTPVERVRFNNAKDNYTVNLKIVEKNLRNNCIDCMQSLSGGSDFFLKRIFCQEHSSMASY